MKPRYLILSISIFLSFYLVISDIPCDEALGCVLAKKYLTYVPLVKPEGLPDPGREAFDFKTLLVYNNKIMVYFADQSPELNHPKASDFTQEKIARRIMFYEVSLLCGDYGNKICSARNYLQKFSKIHLPQGLVDRMAQKGADPGMQCMALPVIDGSRRDSSENVIYICEDSKDKLRDFLQFRYKLSRYIDQFKLTLLKDFYNSANSIAQKEDVMKISDSKRKFSSLLLRLNNKVLQAFADPNNFSSKIFELHLREVDPKVGAKTVADALSQKLITSSWVSSFSPVPIEACCMYLPLVDEEAKLVCSHFNNPAEFNYVECDKNIKSWVEQVNVFIRRTKFSEDYDYLVKNKLALTCNSEYFPTFKNWLEGTAVFDDTACEELKTVQTDWDVKNCVSDRDDDINQEMRKLAGENLNINTQLGKCLVQGFISIQKDGLKASSFLEIRSKVWEKALLTRQKGSERKKKIFKGDLFQRMRFIQTREMFKNCTKKEIENNKNEKTPILIQKNETNETNATNTTNETTKVNNDTQETESLKTPGDSSEFQRKLRKKLMNEKTSYAEPDERFSIDFDPNPKEDMFLGMFDSILRAAQKSAKAIKSRERKELRQNQVKITDFSVEKQATPLF